MVGTSLLGPGEDPFASRSDQIFYSALTAEAETSSSRTPESVFRFSVRRIAKASLMLALFCPGE